MGDRDKKKKMSSMKLGSYSIKTRLQTEKDAVSEAPELSLSSQDTIEYQEERPEDTGSERDLYGVPLDSVEHTTVPVSIESSSSASASASAAPSSTDLMTLMFHMLNNQREETQRLRDVAELREAARKLERQEDIDRLKSQWDEEAAWRKSRAVDQDKLSRVQQAIKSFPKIANKDLVAAQIQNFRDLMASCGLRDTELTSRLPEVLSGQIALAWQTLKLPVDTPFEDAKRQLLHAVGFTVATATKAYLRPDPVEQNKRGAVDSVNYVLSLIDGVLSDAVSLDDVRFRLLWAYYFNMGTQQCISAIAGNNVKSVEEVRQAVATCHHTYGKFLDEDVNLCKIFNNKKNGSGHSGYNRSTHGVRPTCGKCGKIGHKTLDCYSNQPRQVTCYACNQPGHIAPNCPNKDSKKAKDEKNDKKPSVKKSFSVTSGCEDSPDNIIKITVSEKELHAVLDSGTDISVLPRSVVPPVALTGEKIRLVGFDGNARLGDLAKLSVKVGDVVLREEVAVLSDNELNGKALLRLPLKDLEKCEKLLEVLRKERVVNAVETRAMCKERIESEEKEKKVLADESITDVVKLDVLEKNDVELEGVNSASPVLEMHEVNDVVESDNKRELIEKEVLVDNVHDDVGVVACSENCVVLDCIGEGNDRELFIKDVSEDKSLEHCKRLASCKERGYRWEKGLLLHSIVDAKRGELVRIVIPKCRRAKLLALAHDKAGHLSDKKLLEIFKQRFSWPNITSDVHTYVKSCVVCQRANKKGHLRAPMVERPVVSEPFEVVAVDIVGPLPKGKGGVEDLLTTLCMATRWPDVVPLRSITAKAVADALMNVFGRTGLPLQILSDNGSQFTCKLFKNMADILGVNLVHTTPYHPQCNGLIERMHTTLESMLKKAVLSGRDWVDQIPFALFALRQMPCRTTGYSPYELLWGRSMRTPLDVVYAGWRDSKLSKMNLCAWAECLCDKLEDMRDVAVDQAIVESKKRKESYDRGKVDRKLAIGEKVWCRIPGKNGKFEDAWDGPFVVVKVVSAVNYVVEDENGKRKKTVHVNSTKLFVDREVSVNNLTVLADDVGIGDRSVVLKGVTDEELTNKLDVVLTDFSDLLDGSVGLYKGGMVSIEIEEDVKPVSFKPYRIPESLRDGVKATVDQLVSDGWVEDTESPWGAPIVPVPKPDGSIRLCVDYRGINKVTPQIQYPIPHLEDMLCKIGKAKVLSKLDLCKGYYQIPIDEKSRDLTAFITPWGSYRFRVLPFGLKNAPAIFQKLMVKVLKDYVDCATVYIDDVLIFSDSGDEHIDHVRRVLCAIRGAGLKLKKEKCVWGKPRVEYLGHLIGGGQLAVPEHRISAMENFVKPVTKKDMRAFLGSVGYYRRFVKDFASQSALLSPSTSPMAPGKVRWNPAMDAAFQSLCKSLCDHCVLNVPCSSDVFSLHTDASGKGVGSVLNVCRDGAEIPVAFYSRQLRGAEKRYSATELEALAVVQSIQHFLPYLYGRRFHVITDHQPLTSLLSSRNLNKRLQGMALKLSEYDVVLVYRPGVQNGNADGLSRQAWQSDYEDGAVCVSSPDSG